MNSAMMTGIGGAVLSPTGGRRRRRRAGVVSLALAAMVAVSGGVVGVMQGRNAPAAQAVAGPFAHFPQ